MAPSPPPTGLLSGALPTRHVTEDTPPDMLAGSMDLRVTLPSGHTVKMSVERSTPMMDLLVNITTAHKVSPGGHVLQAMGERGVLPYKPSTPIGALDTWSLRVVPRHQVASQQPSAKRAPPKPLALQSSQPFEQTFRLQVRLPRNQLFVARLSPRTALADILVHVCREKNLDPAKYELRHPVNTDQPLQLSLSLADYRVTEVALVPRGSRAPTELSSSDIPALQTHEPATVPGDSRHQRASNAGSSSSTGSFGAMLKRTRSGGTTEGSLSGDSLGGRSSSPTRSDESLGRSVSPPAPRPPLPAAPQQPPPPPRHRKGRAPKPPPPQPTSSGASTARSAPPDAAVTDERCTLVISHSRNSSDSSGYHEASVLSESPENHTNHGRPIDSPPGTLARGKGSKAAKAQHKQFSRSMSNLSSEASTSTVEQSSTQNLSSAYSMSTTSLAKKKRAPAPPAPPAREMKEEPATLDMLASSSDVLEQESTDEERTTLSNGHPRDDEEESVGEDDLDSAFQSVTDVLEEQLRTEALREEDRLAREAYEERLTEEKKRLAAEERMRNEEWLRSEEERKEAEEQRRIIEEERARLVEEREELARQRREQKILEQQLRERLQQELEEKQRAIQLEQRREIERLQREQEELERELREREKEKADRMKQKEARKQRSNQAFFTEQVISDIPDWEYKLPAPPSAFRDKQADVIELTDNLENKDRRNSLESTNSEENADVESKNKLNAMTKDENYSDSESRPPPPAVVEVRVKSPAVGSPPPRVSVQPLRSAQSLYSLSQEDESATCDAPPVVLRKTSSVADVSSMDDDSEALRLQQLQQQFLQWQEQLLSNQSVLQGHVSMPLQSLQVLREILPQMKQKMGEDVTNEGSLNLRSSTLPRTVRTSEVSMEPPSVSTLDRRPAVVTSQRYCPPTVNLGTWSERPKSEVSLKQDSDYRIGVGQHQYTAARAPVVRSAEPKLKDTTNLISGGAVNREVVVRSNSWRTPSVAPHKPSLVVIQSMNASTEQVRASNKPTVILRHEPMSLIDIPPPQRRYTTLVGINGAPQPTAKNNGFQNQQRNITQATNPVVKGFKLDLEPPPPPPPPVIRNLTQKRVPLKSNNADPRDELMDAIRGFGGRSNLRKTRSMQL